MTEETAKLLIEAANRLAAALERLSSGGAGGMPGIHVYHHNPTPNAYPSWYQFPGAS